MDHWERLQISSSKTLNFAIDRFEADLESARGIPSWTVAFIALVSILVMVCLIQIVSIFVCAPLILKCNRVRLRMRS